MTGSSRTAWCSLTLLDGVTSETSSLGSCSNSLPLPESVYNQNRTKIEEFSVYQNDINNKKCQHTFNLAPTTSPSAAKSSAFLAASMLTVDNTNITAKAIRRRRPLKNVEGLAQLLPLP